MKPIIILQFLIGFICILSQKKSKNIKDKKEKDDLKISIGMTFKKYQVGILNKIPDGPLNEEETKKALQDENDKENGTPKNKRIGVIYIAESLRNKRLGKFRVKSEGAIQLMFPTDKNITNYQNTRDTENFQNYMETNRIENEKKILKESETDFSKNPYKEIYDEETKLIDGDMLRVKNKDYKKHLMSLALEKEDEIYHNLLKNELSEVTVKKYNKQFYDPIYNLNQ